MQLLDGSLVHAASDLNAFTECVHLVALRRAVAVGELAQPERDDPTAELLARKGEAHEQRYLARMRARYGNGLVAFSERLAPTRDAYAAAENATVAAMERGVDIIHAATFFDGTFLGRADFLRRVERPSACWPWSYEVIDTKLALSTKPYFLVQLCNYSEHLTRIAGTPPEYGAIVLGSGDERRFRLAEYDAYYRQLKSAYLASVARGDDAYPFECSHCDQCDWRARCARRRDVDDHLSLVAGIRRDQIRKLEESGITTLQALSAAADELRPKRIAGPTFDNLRAQAREQHRYRSAAADGRTARHSYTFRPSDDPQAGFARLPEPSAGDIFFDMEGDPMYRADRGLEYLFGVYLPHEDRYEAFWATSPSAERTAFEQFVDFVCERQTRYPELHVYHYAPYETSALKRLLGRFGSREQQIDDFLRAGTFVDLYPITRGSVWISQPSYSIKKVEALYGFTRATQTRGGDDSIVMFESWLETQDPATLEDIRAYNEDDCRSTFALREWLVALRAERNASLAEPIPWRAAIAQPPAAATIDRSELETQLLGGITEPDSPAALRAAPESERARWLLGHLLNYHRREQKPEWWEHFFRLEHVDELVDGDTKSLGGLRYRAEIASYKISARDTLSVHTFWYPQQEHEMRAGSKPLDATSAKGAGEIVSIDDRTQLVEIKLAGKIVHANLRALIPAKPLDDKRKREVIELLARAYVDGSLERDHPAALALLLARLPQLRDRPRGARLQPAAVNADSLSATIAALARSYLVVQGPPGSGKSTLGAHAIVDLLAAGQRVALAAHSHKALHGLLRKVEANAAERGLVFRGCHKSTGSNSESRYRSAASASWIADSPDIDGFTGCALVSATTFAWAESSQAGAFDTVIIDEAGQVSLADALIAARVAQNVVLLGDPQQLPHVAKGSHPIGTDVSILEHLLGDAKTVAPERGIFLDRSYRMQSAINAFVSQSFYDGRLEADALNAANRVSAANVIIAGPHFRSVAHDGNARRSSEEADTVVDFVADLLAGGTVVLRERGSRPLTAADILVVTPYNVQRMAITEALTRRGLGAVAVGTVDKFQGQEAPVVCYSLTTSNAELAPRGLDFLLRPNRLNVAVSRAQAASLLICSPELLTSRARSIEEMQLLNLLCAYVEAATLARAGSAAATLAETVASP